MRALTKEELKLVSGGYSENQGETWVDDIYVYGGGGGGGDDDWWDPGPDGTDPVVDESGSGGDSGSYDESGVLDAGQQENLKTALEAYLAALENYQTRWGVDAMMQLPGGAEMRVSDLMGSLGKVIEYIEGGTLALKYAQGDPDIGRTAGFLAAFGVGLIGTAASADAMVIFGASWAAGALTEAYVDAVTASIAAAYQEAYSTYTTANPGQPGSQATMMLWMQAWGYNPL